MTQAISVSRIIEELLYEKASGKRLVGSFESINQLVNNANLLNNSHKGIFAFLAFHPNHDKAVREYIEEDGVVKDDSGRRIMVFILSSRPCAFAEPLTSSMLVGDMTIEYPSCPAYELAEWMFPNKPRPVLPGLLLFDTVFDVSESVYISLEACETARAVGAVCRKAFAAAEQSFDKGGRKQWLDLLSASLKRQKIAYRRTGRKSMREWLAAALELSSTTGVTLVALIPKIISKLLGL